MVEIFVASLLVHEFRQMRNQSQRLRSSSSQLSFRPCLLLKFSSQLVSQLQFSGVVASSHRPGRGFSTPPWLFSPLVFLPATPGAVALSHQPGKDLCWPAHHRAYSRTGVVKGGCGSRRWGPGGVERGLLPRLKMLRFARTVFISEDCKQWKIQEFSSLRVFSSVSLAWSYWHSRAS